MPKDTKSGRQTDDTPAGKLGLDPRDPWYAEINKAAASGRPGAVKKVLASKSAGDKAPGGKERSFGRKAWDTVKSIPRHVVMTDSGKGRPLQVAKGTSDSLDIGSYRRLQRHHDANIRRPNPGDRFKNPPVR
jgi:hypothetical protein